MGTKTKAFLGWHHCSGYFFIAIVCFSTWQTAVGDRPGAIDVRIPAYDDNGRLHWELQADEVELLGDKKYNAKQPVMRILEKNRPVSEAYSNSGTFDLVRGSAYGKDLSLIHI